jgi:hypothetical protein
MSSKKLTNYIQSIVFDSKQLKDLHTDEINAPVNYACIFSQSEIEYIEFLNGMKALGSIIEETPTGPLFKLANIVTIAGNLQLLKVRIPDSTRPERGDADFTVTDYNSFKAKFISKPGFKLIQKTGFEMIELMDTDFDVRVYFSNPPLDLQLGLI